MLEILDVDNLYLRQFDALIALEEFHKAVLACGSVMVGLNGRCRRAQQDFCAHHLSKHDGSTTGMVARGRILLLIGGLMLLVDNHQTKILERQEYGTAGSEDDVVRMG